MFGGLNSPLRSISRSPALEAKHEPSNSRLVIYFSLSVEKAIQLAGARLLSADSWPVGRLPSGVRNDLRYRRLLMSSMFVVKGAAPNPTRPTFSMRPSDHDRAR